jgi:hypothetical protein
MILRLDHIEMAAGNQGRGRRYISFPSGYIAESPAPLGRRPGYISLLQRYIDETLPHLDGVSPGIPNGRSIYPNDASI